LIKATLAARCRACIIINAAQLLRAAKANSSGTMMHHKQLMML